MGLIGLDELGPMGFRPGGLGGDALERLMQIAAGQARPGTVRHPRTGRDRPSSVLSDAMTRQRVTPTTTPLQTGGGRVGIAQRAIGWPDRRTSDPGTKSYEWVSDPNQHLTYDGNTRVAGTAKKYNPASGKYETVYRIEKKAEPNLDRYDVGQNSRQDFGTPAPAPTTYKKRGGWFQAILDAITGPRQISAPGFNAPQVPVNPLHQAGVAERARQRAANQKLLDDIQAARNWVSERRVQDNAVRAAEALAAAARRTAEESARLDRARRKQAWNDGLRFGWDQDLAQAVADGRMTRDGANMAQSSRDNQQAIASRGQSSVPGYAPRPQGAQPVAPPPLPPVTAFPAQPMAFRTGSWDWHNQRTNYAAIQAAARLSSPQARQAYQGQATGRGQIYSRTRSPSAWA